jgi:hypothetical protein
MIDDREARYAAAASAAWPRLSPNRCANLAAVAATNGFDRLALILPEPFDGVGAIVLAGSACDDRRKINEIAAANGLTVVSGAALRAILIVS